MDTLFSIQLIGFFLSLPYHLTLSSQFEFTLFHVLNNFNKKACVCNSPGLLSSNLIFIFFFFVSCELHSDYVDDCEAIDRMDI